LAAALRKSGVSLSFITLTPDFGDGKLLATELAGDVVREGDLRPLDEHEREQAILLDLEISGRVMVNELTERFVSRR